MRKLEYNICKYLLDHKDKDLYVRDTNNQEYRLLGAGTLHDPGHVTITIENITIKDPDHIVVLKDEQSEKLANIIEVLVKEHNEDRIDLAIVQKQAQELLRLVTESKDNW